VKIETIYSVLRPTMTAEECKAKKTSRIKPGTFKRRIAEAFQTVFVAIFTCGRESWVMPEKALYRLFSKYCTIGERWDICTSQQSN